jgi:cytochrome P450
MNTDGPAGCPVTGLQTLTQDYLQEPGIAFEHARHDCPVFYDDVNRAWYVTRYDDVRWVLTDYDTFSSYVIQRPKARPPEYAGRLPEDMHLESLLMEDPPDHTVIRKSMNKLFTPKRVAAQDGAARRIGNELIDAFVATGQCELMESFADPLAWRVLTEMVGVPDLERDRLRGWSQAINSVVSAGRGKDAPEPDWEQVADCWDYLGDVLADRRANPRDDVQSAMLATTADDGSPAFPESKMILLTFGILIAGTGNTANLIANTVLMLARHPDAADAVRSDPAKFETAIEEVLRRYPPALQLHRKTTRDVEIAGTTIPAGSMVIAPLPSACTDEEKFPDPLRLDLTRENLYEHLGFGIGRHFCIGAPLARIVVNAALQTLYERIPEIRVPEQKLEFERYPSLRNLLSLDVEWDPAVSAPGTVVATSA